MKILIIGGGVVGLSTAHAISTKYGKRSEIRIIADKYYDETTTYGSGGLWEPYQIAGTPDFQVDNWGKIAFEHFKELYYSTNREKAGVRLLRAYQLYEDTDIINIPSWKDIVYDFEVIDGEKLSKIDKPLIPTRFTKAITFKTFTVDQSYYLKWLTDKLVNMGVQFERRKLNNIDEVCHDGYDIIVNCAGLGASELLSDTEMYPIRGQVLRLDAPFVENIYFFNKSYFIPNVDSLVVGGTAQKGDWSTEPRQEDTDRILNDAIAFFPQIATATIQNVWAGLRPGRTPLRLEMESKVKNETSNSKRRSRIIHNYGHGGSGVTIAWGCAQEVAEMIEQALPLMMPRARL